MKFFRVIGRSIRDAFKSVGRNFSLSIAAITCVVITLIIVGVALVIKENVESATSKLEKDLSIVVFISNDADSFDINSLETQIKGIENVDPSYVMYQSKAEIKNTMMEESDTFKNIMEDWDDEENPLQSVFIVKVLDAKKIGETATAISNLDNVTKAPYGQGMVEQLIEVFDGIKNFAYIAVIALVLVTVFLIINTIKLTIFSRKREISIMRLVGASNSSIKLPFVFEGMLIGIIGAIVPIILVVYGYYSLYNILGGKLITDIITLVPPKEIVFKIGLFILGIGAIVGMIGSSSAVKKYLKV